MLGNISAIGRLCGARKRAEQLIQGSMPKIQTRHKKPTKIARLELAEGAFNWQFTAPQHDEAVAAVFGDTATTDEEQ